MVLLCGRMWCLGEEAEGGCRLFFRPASRGLVGIVSAGETSNYVEAQNLWEQVEDQEHKMEFRNRGRLVRPRAMQVMGAQLIKGVVALSGPWRLANDGREGWGGTTGVSLVFLEAV